VNIRTNWLAVSRVGR